MGKSDICCTIFVMFLSAGFIAMIIVGGIHHVDTWGVVIVAVGAVLLVATLALTAFYCCFKDFKVMG